MALLLLFLNVLLAAAVAVACAVSAGRRRRRRATERDQADPKRGGTERPLAALLVDLLSRREPLVAGAAEAIARKPALHQAGLASLTTVVPAAAPRARMAILWAIRTILDTRPELATLCWRDPNPEVRAVVLSSLRGRAGDRDGSTRLDADRIASVIEAGGRDSEPIVRRAAYANLHILSAERAAAMVWRGLDDADDEVRRHACAGLSGCGDPDSIARIVERLSTTPRAGQAAVRRAVSLMTAPVVPQLLRIAFTAPETKIRVAALKATAAAGLPSTSVELLKVSSGLAAFSGLYYAIAVLSDATYREEFLSDLQTSLHETFADRARYLQARAAAG